MKILLGKARRTLRQEISTMIKISYFYFLLPSPVKCVLLWSRVSKYFDMFLDTRHENKRLFLLSLFTKHCLSKKIPLSWLNSSFIMRHLKKIYTSLGSIITKTREIFRHCQAVFRLKIQIIYRICIAFFHFIKKGMSYNNNKYYLFWWPDVSRVWVVCFFFWRLNFWARLRAI